MATYLDTVSTIIRDENLLLVIDNNTIRELQVIWTVELMSNIAVLIKNNNSHHFALNNDDSSLVVYSNSSWITEGISTKLAHKLSILVIDLDLMSGRALSYDDITTGSHHGNPVGIQQLSISLSTLSKLEFEPTLLVENLNSVIISVSHNNIILGIDSYSTWLCELAFQYSKFTKFAVIDHLLSFDL